MNSVFRRVILQCCGLALLICACGAQAQETPLNLIVATQGEVLLRRDGWAISTPVAAGTQLGPLDTLEIRSGGQATILCSAASAQVIHTSQRNPCNRIEDGQADKDGASYSPGQRQPSDIPYPITARSTALLEPQPVLAWHDTGARSYSVSVIRSDDNVTIWSTTGITQTRMRYSQEPGAALVPGVSYRVVVVDETTGLSSADHPTAGGGFTLIADDERQHIAQQIKSIRERPELDDAAKSLAEAMLLMRVREAEPPIAGEAWLQLETTAPQINAPGVYLQLGNALLAMQLPTEAARAYQTAIDRASALGDIESQAEGLIGQAIVLHQRADCDKAAALFQQLADPRAETVSKRCPL